MFRTKRSKIIAIICVLALLIAGTLSYLWYSNHSDKMAQVTQTYQPGQIPASKAEFTSYTDAHYAFRISYPSDWKVNQRAYKGEEDVALSYQVDAASPDLHALTITCLANPQQLTAQQWSNQTPDLTSQGKQTLTSGTGVFVSTGHGQTDYTIFIAVSGNKVCEIGTEPANANNQPLITKVVNSFVWQ